MPGLPVATLDLLADLADLPTGGDGARAWFAARRDRYEEAWLAPALELAAELAPAVAGLDPDLVVEPRVGGSVFRIHRDRRFAPDRPYKPYLDLMAWHGDRATTPSALYLRVHPDRVEVSTGVRRLEGTRLRAWRDLVVDPDRGRDLRHALDTVIAGRSQLAPPDLVGRPRTHTTDDPDRLALLRCRHAHVMTVADPPASMDTGRFVPWVVRRWQEQLPWHRHLVDHLPPA